MYCPKCGAQIAPGARFCSKCGAPVGSADNVYGGATPAGPSNGSVGYAGSHHSAGFGKGKLIAIGAVALVVVALLACWIFGVFGGGGYEKTVDNFMEALLDMDAEGVVDTLNDKVLRVHIEDGDFITKRELIEEIDDEMWDAKEAIKERSIKLDYEIVYTEDLRGENLEEVKEMYHEEYRVRITAAKIVDVEVTMKAMGYTDSMVLELGLVEIDGSWYIDAESMEDALYEFL